jgi:hypothetical protein
MQYISWLVAQYVTTCVYRNPTMQCNGSVIFRWLVLLFPQQQCIGIDCCVAETEVIHLDPCGMFLHTSFI